MKANIFVADELENKVFHLSKALTSASEIIAKLEEENKNLKAMLAIMYDLQICDNQN